MDYVFSAEELRTLLNNNPSAKQLVIRLEMGVIVQPKQAKGKAVIATTISAFVKNPKKTKKKLGDGDGTVLGYPDPPGPPTNS